MPTNSCEDSSAPLFSERADHTHTGKILLCRAEHAVQPPLHAPVERNAAEHDGKDHREQKRNDHRKNPRGFDVDRERHDHRTEYHKRRPQQKPQREVKPRLHLIHVACHARHQRRRAESVKLGIGKALHLLKDRVAHTGGKADCRLRRKILRGHGGGKPQKPQPDQKQAPPEQIPAVAGGNAGVDNVCHNQRHKQLQKRLEELEERS